MSTTVAINGFGRIGRLVFRQLMERSNGEAAIRVAAINDVAPLDNLAYLLRHDSAQRPPGASIEASGDTLVWDDREVLYLSERNPAALPWKERGIDVVVESSGQFTHRDHAAGHLDAGAQRVVITAPAKGDVTTICPGVNDDAYDPDRDTIVSTASCTTNCLAPVAKVLNDRFGIRHGALTTVHAYTSSQGIVDGPAKKWRRGRAGAANIVPTSTGAAVATTLVLPELEGKLDGMAMRVPVIAGSVIDFVATTERPVTPETVNDAFREAAEDAMRGILDVSDEELVSADVVGRSTSALIDAPSTMCFGEHMVKILAWYDNEWGYAARVADWVERVAAGPSATP